MLKGSWTFLFNTTNLKIFKLFPTSQSRGEMYSIIFQDFFQAFPAPWSWGKLPYICIYTQNVFKQLLLHTSFMFQVIKPGHANRDNSLKTDDYYKHISTFQTIQILAFSRISSTLQTLCMCSGYPAL